MFSYLQLVWSAVIPTIPVVPGFGPFLMALTVAILAVCVVGLWLEREREMEVRIRPPLFATPTEHYAAR
jgi:hypothetical protein